MASGFSKAWREETKRRQRVKYAERQIRKGKATAHTVGVLRDEARRLERQKGIKGGERVKQDRALKRMSREELAELGKKYAERISRAEAMPKQRKIRPRPQPVAEPPTPPAPPTPSQDVTQEPVPPYGMPDKFGAWDDFKDWLADQGIILDPSDPNYRKMLEYSREIGDSGMFSQSEQFQMLCDFYMSGQDIEEI